jgi:hypothetical protein
VNSVGGGLLFNGSYFKVNVLGEFAERCARSEFIIGITKVICFNFTQGVTTIIVEKVPIVTRFKLVNPNSIATNNG